METEIILVTEENLDEVVQKATKLLKNGELVGMPTETVYGLAANAFDKDAVKKIYKAKGRPADNPVIVHISDFVMLRDIAEVNEIALELAKEFWPGPLTLVLNKKPSISDEITCSLPTVAVRMPSNYISHAVISAADVPLAAPSANLSGKPSSTTAKHVFDDFFGKIPLILDGGPSELGIESTVVSVVGEKPVLLRPGMITLEMLATIAPDIQLSNSIFEELESGKPVESPGIKYKHYSPNAEVILVKGSLEGFIRHLKTLTHGNICAMCFDTEQEKIPIPSISYGDINDHFSQGRRLFSALRMVDKLGSSKVYVRVTEDEGDYLAIYNRLLRAASFKVIEVE
ncbi:MAG: threonylcarbamoyl-AMP synthase [Ruminococcaceae bacterium]|nr:threonylcarbamoyl-AMP synthase [Oscillospiraceae bacterium]